MDKIDIVYTWVDDSFPGYLAELNRYADDPRDLNPNRTRDNLEVMRFSLRSVARNCPWVRRIYLVTCRPQVPDWLNVDHPQLHLIHHDQIMPAEILPTYNSFCINSFLHALPGITDRFVYFEDDMLAMRPGLMEALVAPDGRPYVHFDRRRVDPRPDPAKASPWNLALAHADRALSQRYGGGPRAHNAHTPQLREVATYDALCTDFAAEIATTRGARFRGPDNVPPEFLGPHFAAQTGAAAVAPEEVNNRLQGYVSIENFTPWTWWQLRRLDRRQPLAVTLNDSFGARPNPRVVAMVRRWLERHFPEPSPWER